MFRQEKISSSVNEIVYQVKYRGREVIGNSRAGLQLDNRTWELALARKINQVKCWMDNLEVDSVIYQPAVNKSWHPLYGERSTVREAYNEATMYLSKKDGSNYRLNIEVRAYDEGIAFRYFFPEHPQAIFHKVVGDLTEYTFSPGAMAWAEQWAQAPFEHLAINDIKQPVERALTVELSNGLVVERRGKNSELRVTDPTGQRAGQTLLDSFVSAFALDLPRFLDAGDKDKADILLGIIGVKDQLAKLDLEIQKVYDERHSLGRIADQKKKFAQELPYWEGMPAEPISASELIRRQQEILARNGENQRKRAKAAQLDAQAKALQSRVTALSEQLKQLADQYDACLRDLQIANTDAADLQDESTAELEESLRTIEQQNAKIRQNLDRQRAVAEAEQYEQQYADCTRQLAGLRQDRLDLLQGADLPLPGLSVNESGQLTYQDKAWDCMSGAQQQRLCIARALAVQPEVLLMDEPTSALDPISTSKIEDLAVELKKDYTIVMVTHNMQQAARISDKTAFFLLGEVVEYGETEQIFSMPKDKRTEDYITGRFG